jgi:hypothetical protein
MVAIGDELIQAKGRLKHGLWLTWLAQEFDWSEDTATNYMNVARRMRNVPTNTKFDARAMYLLSAKNTPETARNLAIDLATAGTPIDYEAAYILARAPIPVQKRFTAGELTKSQAYGLTQQWGKTAPEVQTFALEHAISESAVLAYLNRAYQERAKRTTWADVVRDGGRLVIEDEVVLLRHANERDIERYTRWRQWCHLEAARQAEAEKKENGLQTITRRLTVEWDADRERVISIEGLHIPASVRTVEIEVTYKYKVGGHDEQGT